MIITEVNTTTLRNSLLATLMLRRGPHNIDPYVWITVLHDSIVVSTLSPNQSMCAAITIADTPTDLTSFGEQSYCLYDEHVTAIAKFLELSRSAIVTLEYDHEEMTLTLRAAAEVLTISLVNREMPQWSSLVPSEPQGQTAAYSAYNLASLADFAEILGTESVVYRGGRNEKTPQLYEMDDDNVKAYVLIMPIMVSRAVRQTW